MTAGDLCFELARVLRDRIARRELSARELLEAHLSQIARVDPAVNAIVTRCEERSREAAARADEAQARGEPLGVLHGLPVAHKDLVETRGLRTTYGSPIFAEHVPEVDALLVERLRAAGAITLGKTNVPEFGAGSHTFNPVFGPTRNPFDPTRTCGGSSGGAAVALACGMVPIADGSDMGGSLRNPAGYCNVVGFRPSPGRVPSWPSRMAWSPLSVAGPMARTVADAALLLSAMAGPDPRSPIALDEPGARFAEPLERDFRGVRIAWSPDLGALPVDPRVTRTLAPQRKVLEALGCQVEDACPDFGDADEIFQTLRALEAEAAFGPAFEPLRERIKDTLVWNVERGRAQSGPDVGRAEILRTRLYQRVREFMEEYAFLALPVSQVPPFEVELEYPTRIGDVAMQTYIDWMKSCYWVTVTGHPAISVPAGFTDEGLPVGLQLVGRHRDDFGVLQLAHAFEGETGFWRRRPPLAEPRAT